MSPISAAAVVARGTELRQGLGQMVLDGADVYWIEGRPHESGRNVVIRRTPDGATAEASPPGWSVRTRAHEYGGGDFTAAAGILYFAHDTDQRLYAHLPGCSGPPRALTPPLPLRFADLVVDLPRQRLLAVLEDHTASESQPSAALVAVALDGSGFRRLAEGHAFYSSPAVAPDGRHLAWLAWDHPNMPWDGCELWLAEVDSDGWLCQPKQIAGGADESIFQPSWSPAGVLHFTSDRTGWANLYRWNGDEAEAILAGEFEAAAPQWNFGDSTFGFSRADEIVCAYATHGRWQMTVIDTISRACRPLELPYTDIAHVRANGGRVYFRAGSPTKPYALVELDLASNDVRSLCGGIVDPRFTGYLATPEAMDFPTADGSTAHAFLYRPRNADFELPEGSCPPAIVMGHGGPTAAASTCLELKIQFWTSRGFAVIDVNYRGSTGFGRAYREALQGAWGVADVEDCVYAARYAVTRGEADSEKLAIRGGSAGGFTCLCALTFHDVFRAGACLYGISDLEALVHDTHKFESRYTDRLVGPYPERRDVYRARSPIHHVDGLRRPLIVLQGLQDTIVPPNQSELIVAALRAKGVPVAYVTFAEEGHGFRDARNAQTALEVELAFYLRIFGLPADPTLPPLTIENL